jgi:primary-amine oxidase
MPPCVNEKIASSGGDLVTDQITSHPLDPLNEDEIKHAVDLIKQEHAIGESFRFHGITLHEPPKHEVFTFVPGESEALDREAFLILREAATGKTFEAIVNLTKSQVRTWNEIPGVQPPISSEEMEECELLVKGHPDFQAALQKRGLLDDLHLVVVDVWAIGNFGFPQEEGTRLTRGICYIRSSEHGNFYSRPIDGLIPVVDLNAMKVLAVEDLGVVPVPPAAGNYAKEFQKSFRQDVKPLEIQQPEGPSFQVKGRSISWQKWHIRVGKIMWKD